MSGFKHIMDSLIFHFDKLFVIFGIMSIFLYVFISKTIFLFSLGFIFILAPITYSLLDSNYTTLKFTNKINPLINIFYLLSFIIMFINIYYYSYDLIRNICISVITILVVFETLFITDNRYQNIIIKIVLLGLLIRCDLFFNIYNLPGIDSKQFIYYINSIIQTGYFNKNLFGQYINYPIYFMFIGIFSKLCQFNIKTSIFIGTVFPWLFISTLLCYIYKNLFKTKGGLLAFYFFIISDYTIANSINVRTWSFVLPLYILLLYFVYKKENTLNRSFIMIYLYVIISLTHPLSQLISILLFVIPSIFSYIFYNNIIFKNESLMVVIILWVSNFYREYLTNKGNINNVFFLMFNNFIKSLFNAGVLNRPEKGATITFFSFIIDIFNVFGYSVLVFFGLLGVIYLIKNKKFSMTIIYLTGILFSVPLFFGFIGARTIFPNRWFIYLYAPLSILSTRGFIFLINKIYNNKTKIFLVILITFMYSFSMTYNEISFSNGSTIFNHNRARTDFYKSELNVAHFLKENNILTSTGRFLRHAINIEISNTYEEYLDSKHDWLSYDSLSNPVDNLNGFIWLSTFTERSINVQKDSGDVLILLNDNFKYNLEQNFNNVYSSSFASFYYSRLR